MIVYRELVHRTTTFFIREPSVDSFRIKGKDRRQIDEINQSEREETEVDSLFNVLLEEHGNVDEEEDGDEDGGPDSVKELLCLKTDQVVGVIPQDGRAYALDGTVSWDTAC